MDLIIAWNKESDLKYLVPELLLKSLGSTWVWTFTNSHQKCIWPFSNLGFLTEFFFFWMLKLNCDKDSSKALWKPVLSFPGPQFGVSLSFVEMTEMFLWY